MTKRQPAMYHDNMSTTVSSTSSVNGQTPGQIREFVAIKSGYCGGKPHIEGHRIKVQDIAIWHERMGLSPEEIAASYPTISLPAIYAALAYYHSHRSEIDADIAADEALVADMKAKAGPSPLQQKLTELHAQKHSVPS